MARIKIDIAAGILEVEGDEKFLKEIYEDFKSRVAIKANNSGTLTKALKAANAPDEAREKASKSKGKPTSRKESYAFVKDLNLRGDGDEVVSLKAFFEDKRPSSAMEMTTVFVYYLCRIAAIDKVGLDHIYTCYKEVGKKVPAALRQNLLDTAHRKGTIDTSSLDAITVTTRGENMVELDLPAQDKRSKDK